MLNCNFTYGVEERSRDAWVQTAARACEEVEIEFIAMIRADETFANTEALATQMRADCQEVQAILARIEADDPMRRFPLGSALSGTGLSPLPC